MTEYLVINSNDSGIGSLRFGINSGLYTDIILIDGLTEINLSSTIYIHSNITLTMNAPSPIYIQCNSDTIFTLADWIAVLSAGATSASAACIIAGSIAIVFNCT